MNASPPAEAISLELAGQRATTASLERRFLRASGLVTIGNVAGRVVSLVIGIVTARLLTEAEFGAFGLIQSTLGMFGAAAGLSLGMAATRYVALYRKGEPQRVPDVILVVFTVGTASTVLTSIVMAGVAPALARGVLGGDESLVTPLRWAAVQLAATSLFGMVAGVLGGLERFGLVGFTTVLQNVAILGACAFLIPLLRLPGAIAAQAAGLALALVVATWALRGVLGQLSLRSVRGAFRRESRLLLDFCLPNILASLVTLPAAWASTIMIARLPNGYAELAYFTAADRFRLLLNFVAGFVGTALLPILAGAVASDAAERRDGQRSVELGLLGTGLLVLPLTAMFAFAGSQFMSAFGRSYETNWAVLLPVVAWGAAGAIGSIVGTALIAHGRQWFLFVQQVTYGIAILVLTWWLRPLGGAGLGIAHLGAVLLLLAWSYPVIRRLGVLSGRATRQLVILTVLVCGIAIMSWACPPAWRLSAAPFVILLSVIAAMAMLSAPERAQLVRNLNPATWRHFRNEAA